MSKALVHMTEELPKDQSVCLFRAADLPVEDFHSSSTLQTTASVKLNGKKQYLELHLAARDSYLLLINT